MKPHSSKTKSSLAIGLPLMFAAGIAAAASFTPVALDPSSFNQDNVIEAAAPRSINEYVTVTPDQGTNKNANTWYEVGYCTNSVGGLQTGLPLHNSLVSGPDGTHTFQMPPDYHTNNALFVGHNNSTWTPINGPATLTLTTPTNYTSLSFLSGSGNGPCLVLYVIHYVDGSTEQNTFTSIDWWDGAAANKPNKVFDAQGLVSMNGAINNQSTNHGSAFYADVAVGNTSLSISNIDFYWRGNGTGHNPYSNGRTIIFAVSGDTNASGIFHPIAVSGYNQDVVVENDAPKTAGADATAVTGTLTNTSAYVTFTSDGGLSKQNWTWMERGYYTTTPNAGLPVAGSTITSATRPDIQYTMPSTYAGNCAVCLSSNGPTANIKLATPTAYGAVSLLGASGNGSLNIRCEIQFAGGQTETNWISTTDWFNQTDPWSYVSFGQTWPAARAVRNTPDQFVDVFENGAIPPFSRDPRTGGAQNPGIPIIRLFDVILPITNSSSAISNIVLVATNAGAWTTTPQFFAVSGGAGAPPLITQPAGIVTDSAIGVTNGTSGAAVNNDFRYTKGWQGTNNISLWVSNRMGLAEPVSYQWKRTARGGGLRDIYKSWDLTTFANVSGPNISGATSNFLTISNATLADSADYLVVASNPYGAVTSFVATVMALTTNAGILVGQSFGDTITKYTSDGTSGNGQETFVKAIDQAAQKWLSTGLGGTGFDSFSIPQGTVPFVGPVGYIVTPVNGQSVVNTIRFYSANDSQGRDPRDFTLEGSNDGTTWTTIIGRQLLGSLSLPTARGGTGTTPLAPFSQPLVEVNFANSTAWTSYRLTITNCYEPIATPLMQVAEIQLLGTLVPNPPVWVRQPVPAVDVFVGTAPTWGVLAGGYPAPKFQWYRGGVLIPGATGNTYTLTNAQLSDSGATFSCLASNIGGFTNSTISTLTVTNAPVQPYPAAVLANSPIGYWRLDELDNTLGNDGVVTTDYAGGHNGYYSNVVLSVAGYNPSTDPDTAAQFGGVTPDSYVENINDVDFSRGTNGTGARFSVEAWVNGGNQSIDAAIVTKGYNGILNVGTGTGTEQFALDVSGGNPRKFRFVVRETTGAGHAAQSSIVPYDPFLLTSVWHHLVGVCDEPNGVIYLYVDGMLAASTTIPVQGGIQTQPLPMTIGARRSTLAADYDQIWVGIIDDVAIYNTALSPSQVLAHFYAAQRPPVFALQPASTTISENVLVTFSSSAYGPGTVTYQWYNSDGSAPTTPIGGQISSNLTFTTSSSQNLNWYQVVAANSYGSVTSAPAQLTVVSGPPQYAQDLPTTMTVLIGHIIQLQVNVQGTAPFTYQWQKGGVNIVDDYRTSGSQTNTLIIGYATNTDAGNYQVIVNNGSGTTPSATLALTVATSGHPQQVQPFNAARTGWAFQGTGTGGAGTGMGNNVITNTVGAGGTQSSAWLSNKVDVTSFVASFVYWDVSGAGSADGVTFCLQNSTAGTTALGGGGGSLGYSGITPSVALAMNIYQPQTRGVSFFTNGAIVTPFSPILPVGLGDNSDPIQVNVSYNGTVLSASFQDLITGSSYNTNLTFNIPAFLGANTAFAGFTGADGGVASTQVISNFTMAPTPVRIRFQTTNALVQFQTISNALVLSWPATTAGFLRTTPSVASPAVWGYSTDLFRVVGGQATVTIPTTSGNKFYRLDVLP